MSAFTLNEKMVWILRWSYEVLSWGNYHKKSHKWIVVLSYFNAQIKIWYESGKITYRGTEIDGVMCQFEFYQQIQQLAHIIGETSPYIDLIFTFYITHPFIKTVTTK